MESSTVLAFRIFVMLSCLIIVPLAAIFGSAFPDVVKSVLVDKIVAWGNGRQGDSSGERFQSVTPMGTPTPRGAGAWEAPRWGEASAAGAWQPTDVRPAGPVVAAGSVGPTIENQPAAMMVPADASRSMPPVYPSMDRGGTEPLRHLAPEAAAQLRSPFGYSAGEPSGVPGAALPRPLEQPDRFSGIQRKLRDAGAIYYLLETWGQQGELYRFHCKLALGGSPNHTRHFEATDRDALRAMGQVLEQVESWRSGRPQ